MTRRLIEKLKEMTLKKKSFEMTLQQNEIFALMHYIDKSSCNVPTLIQRINSTKSRSLNKTAQTMIYIKKTFLIV